MRTQIALVLTLLVVALSTSPSAQVPSADEKLSFEVASIKPNKSAQGGGWSGGGGRQTIVGTTTRVLIMHAFEVRSYEIIGGPAWLDGERLDVLTKADGEPTAAQQRAMMRSLLEERFALKAHRETRDGPKYRLVLARKDGTLGPELVKSDIDCADLRHRGERPPVPSDPRAIAPCGMRMGPGDLMMGARLFADFVGTLESLVGRRIDDQTGLSGPFDLRLEWSRGQNDTVRPSIFTAIQEQLGLKLEPTRGPVTVLVIDSIERPTPD